MQSVTRVADSVLALPAGAATVEGDCLVLCLASGGRWAAAIFVRASSAHPWLLCGRGLGRTQRGAEAQARASMRPLAGFGASSGRAA